MPFVNLDGYFLKEQTSVLFTIMGYDANGQLYLFAFILVE